MSRYRAVYDCVKNIPRGRISTYGAIAAALPGITPRMVGYALHACPRAEDIPWWRVVNSRGSISLPPHAGGEVQSALLRSEGVTFAANGRIDLKHYLWHPATDD
ncbi:MAG TPA: methyltransferase [Caldithrix abyssi]|uniref:Methyltransferase n=1 Tax=Caldithrix abyssi TaxID=187145 RepID=A0A7V5VFJ1_CALAY|nr:methyltransferase [Caldithrix abyssi]